MPCDVMRCGAMRCDAVGCGAVRCVGMRCDAMRCDAMRCKVVGWVPVADSVGYVLLSKGGASAGAKWRYRVVCRDGAFVRHGIELASPFLFNLPWHSVVEVSQESNPDMSCCMLASCTLCVRCSFVSLEGAVPLGGFLKARFLPSKGRIERLCGAENGRRQQQHGRQVE